MTDDRCIVCGDKAARPLTAPLIRCPSCQRPCHSKCSGKRKDSSCDLCRKNAPTPSKKEAATTINKRQNEQNKQNSTQVSTRNVTLPSQRRTSAPSRSTPPHRESFNSSTPSVKRPAQTKKKSVRTSQRGASVEAQPAGQQRRLPMCRGQALPTAQQRRLSTCRGTIPRRISVLDRLT